MSKQIQLRRGTTAEHATFAGAVGEVTVDTTKDTLVVHDGSLNGGYPLAKASDITSFISLDDLSATTGLTYAAGVFGADTDVLATKTFVTTTVNAAVAGKDNTDEITEGVNNLYFTTARARDAISVTDSGGDGSLSYSNGVITYVGPSASDVRAHFTASNGISITNGAISVDSTVATKTYVDSNIATALATKDNTDEITEGSTNLYYTNSRARNAISLTDASGDGSLTYNTLTGAFVYTGPSANEVRAHFTAGTGVTITAGQIAADTAVMATRSYVDTAISGKDNTDEITEGLANLYFTNTRARGAVSVTDNGGDGSLAYDSGTGVFSYTGPSATEVRAHFTAGTGITIATGQVSVDTSVIATKSYVDTSIASKDNTDEITEGTSNLYFTNTRARSSLSFAAGSGAYDSTTGVITIPTDNASLTNGAGYITGSANITGSAAKWTTPRTIFLAGDLTGSVAIDGSNNATLTATIAGNSVALGSDTTGNYVASIANGSYITGGGVGSEGATLTIGVNATSANNGGTVVARNGDGDFSAGIITAALSGNATTATTLQTARTISLTGDVTGSVSFNGSANAAITTTIAANSVALGTDTTGNYVAGLTAGTGVTVSGTAGEGWSPTVSIGQDVSPTANVTFNNVNVDGSIVVDGNLTVSGTTTTITATNLAVSDNMLYMNQAIESTVTNAVGNGTSVVYTVNSHNYTVGMSVSITGVNPTAYNLSNQTITAVTSTTFTVSNSATGTYVSGGTARAKANSNPDLGIAAGYNDGTYAHTGFFRDATDGYWKAFKGYTPEPDASAFIDTSHASFQLADIQAANFRGPLVGNASTATTLQTARTLSLSGDASGSVSFDGSGNVELPVTVADNSHNHTIANVTGLQTALDGKATKSALVTATTNGGSYALDVVNYDTFAVTLGANTTISVSGTPSNHTTFTLVVIQDATGGRTITWPASFKFNGGIAPPQTTTANAVDVWSILTYNGGSTYIVSLAVKDAK